MNPEMLKDYNQWLKRSPNDILDAVKKVGGWAKVFPGGLPLWAHRVRNYFNLEPMVLTPYDKYTSTNLIGQIHEPIKSWKGSIAQVKGFRALSGDVYKDEKNVTWFQMDAASTVYHFDSHMVSEAGRGIGQHLLGQSATPVFKLIAFDGTGGSRETILQNMPVKAFEGVVFERGTTIPAGFVAHLTVTDLGYQGSYNYAETTDSGPAGHTKYDVDTHKKWPKLYLNPSNRFSNLSERRFPVYDDRGKALASQI